jgi:LCP family protein required for cell wall assembly
VPIQSKSTPAKPQSLIPKQFESSDSSAQPLLNLSLPNSRYSKEAEVKSKKSKHKAHRKWSLKRKIWTSLALLLIIGLGLGGWDVWQLDHKVNHLSVGNLTASVGGAENILIAGSTNRCNLTVQNAQWGFCSDGVTGINSDIIFIVHIAPKTHTVSLLSIPRDTFVPNARSGDEAFKVDAALYQGPTQLVDAVQEDFGIPIQHYAEVGFDGFVNIVNAVGGVKMDFPMPVYDSESYLDVKTPGCKLLNGDEALQVVRSRHLQYDPPGLNTTDVNLWPQEAESDIARIARTHEFLRVLASTVAARGLNNPITDQKLVDAIAPQVQVDSGLSTSAMIQLMEEFHSVNINNVPQYTLPISTTSFGSYDYQGENMGDVVFPVEDNDQNTINQFLGVTNTTDTLSGKPLPSPSTVTVNVINGSGVSDQAEQVTDGLTALGFDMVGEPGSAKPVSPQAQETVVNYAGPSTEADAEAVAHKLTGYIILAEDASALTSGSDVTVTTGTGLAVNAASSTARASSASVAAGSSTTGSSTAGSATQSATSSASAAADATDAGLEPASSPNQPLSAWDPRACSSS